MANIYIVFLGLLNDCLKNCTIILVSSSFINTWGRFHEKSQFKTSFGPSLGLKSETFVLAEFLAQIDFTKGDSAETGLNHSLKF